MVGHHSESLFYIPLTHSVTPCIDLNQHQTPNRIANEQVTELSKQVERLSEDLAMRQDEHDEHESEKALQAEAMQRVREELRDVKSELAAALHSININSNSNSNSNSINANTNAISTTNNNNTITSNTNNNNIIITPLLVPLPPVCDREVNEKEVLKEEMKSTELNEV
jgi:hypothetical protein